MKKKIIIGSLFSVVILLLIPAVSGLKNTISEKEHIMFLFEKNKWITAEELRQHLDGGFGLLELFIAFLMFLYIELGIIFNRSFTLILLLANILYEIGVRLGLIEPTLLVEATTVAR